MMKGKTLYVSDMDGTLLGSDGRGSDRTAGIITRLSYLGVPITVATARTPATVRPLLAQTHTIVDAVVMTGAATWSRADNVYTDVRYMSAADVRRGLDLCAECGVHPFVYTMGEDRRSLDVYHRARELNKAEEGFYLERAKLKRFHIGQELPEAAEAETALFFAIGVRVAVESAAKELRERSECAVCCYPDIYNPGIGNLEVFAPGVSKAAAVRELKKKTGASRLVVFGDNLNDLPMLAEADLAVAVGNALPAVKEAADIVIEPNYTDSVARFIEYDSGL